MFCVFASNSLVFKERKEMLIHQNCLRDGSGGTAVVCSFGLFREGCRES